METKEIINKFVEQIHQERQDLKAVLFYGSSCYHTNKENSDIDLLLITASGLEMRGKTILEGKKIDYTIKPLKALEQDCMTSIAKQETFLLSVFQNGEIIYNEDRTIEKFQKYFRFRHQSNLPTYEINRQEKEILQRNYQELCHAKNTDSFWVIYFNLLNRVRIDYQMHKGYSRIPLSKVYQFYQNRAYAEQYYCSVLPPETFTNQFLASINVASLEQATKEIENYAPLFTIEFIEKMKSSKNFVFRKENFYQTPKMNALKITATQLISKYDQTILALLENKNEANYLYYIVVEQLRRFYEVQCGVLNESMESVLANYQESLKNRGLPRLDPEFIANYFKAIAAKENQDKIKYLDILFNYALKDIPMNTQDYLITLQK
jgi:predicted nucleotidyltransferase